MQQHQMNDYHQPSAMMTKFAKNGVALSQEERAALARRKGLCVGCGIKTHTVSVFKKTPITNDYVYKGICISCHPDRVPSNIFADYQKHNPRIHAPLVQAETGGSDAEMLQRRRRQQVLEARRREQEQQAQQQQHQMESPRPRKAPFPDRRIQHQQQQQQQRTQQQQQQQQNPTDKIAATNRLNEQGIGGSAQQQQQQLYSSPVSKKEIVVAPPPRSPASPSPHEHSDFGAIQAYLVQERRPVTIQVQDSSLTTANGMYEFDPTMAAGNAKQYPAYSKHGFLEEAAEVGGTPVTFLIHRSASRWFLSAVLKNGGRVYLYCAPVTPSKPHFPPSKGWAKMNGVAGTASLSIVILTTEEVPATPVTNSATKKQKPNNNNNNREITLQGIPELPFGSNHNHNPPPMATSHHSRDPPARYSRPKQDAPTRNKNSKNEHNNNAVSANSDHSDATEITSNNHQHYIQSHIYGGGGGLAGTGGVSETMMRDDDVSSLTTHSTIPGGGGVNIPAPTPAPNSHNSHDHSVATQRVSNNNIAAGAPDPRTTLNTRRSTRPHQPRLQEVSEITFDAGNDAAHTSAAAATATATTTAAAPATAAEGRRGSTLSQLEQEDLQLLFREMDASGMSAPADPYGQHQRRYGGGEMDESMGAASAVIDPYGHQRRCSGLQNEQQVMEDLNLSALETPKTSQDLVWNPEDSAHISLDDYDALPQANTNDLFFPWEKPKTAAGSGSSLVAGRVTIQITTPTQQEFYVIMNAKPTTTIRELKAEIQKRQGIPTAQQELTQGRNKWPTLLVDDNTLESYGLFNTSANASAPNVDMHFPPGYPCRRLLIECLGETHNVDVDPCDTIERVIQSIRTKSTWFLDQLRYMPKPERERIGIQLKLEGQKLRDTKVTLAELNIPNQTIMEMEVLTAIDVDKIACAAAYQEETLQQIMKESKHSAAEQSFKVDQLDLATAKQAAYDAERALEREKKSTHSSSAAAAPASSAEPTKEDLLARLAECSAHQEKVFEAVKKESTHSSAVVLEAAAPKMESTRSAGEDSFAIEELVKKPAAKTKKDSSKAPDNNNKDSKEDVLTKLAKGRAKQEESREDLLAKLAKCRAYQEEVMEKINHSSAEISHTLSIDSRDSQSNNSLRSSETGGSATAAAASKGTDDDDDDKPAPRSSHHSAPQVTLTEAAGTASSSSAPRSSHHHSAPQVTLNEAAGTASSSSFDASKLAQDVAQMKQKVELLERETQHGMMRPPAPGSVQILPAKIGDVSIGMPVVVMAPPAPPARNSSMGLGTQPPTRAMPSQRSQHSQRISRLEEKVAAYEDQISALLKVMELTHAGGATNDDELMKRRVALAHKILRGEQDSVLERAVYGFQMDEGDCQPNGQ